MNYSDAINSSTTSDRSTQNISLFSFLLQLDQLEVVDITGISSPVLEAHYNDYDILLQGIVSQLRSLST